MGDVVSIGYLADHPEWVEELAHLHWQEWGQLIPSWDRKQASEELREHTQQRRGIPTTLIAFDGSLLLGSVSLEAYDYAEIQQWTPWLTSLWVMPFARHRGLGSYLVRRVLHEAACLGIQRLHLLTEEHKAFYENLGWQALEVCQAGEHTLQILSIMPTSMPTEQSVSFH